MIGIEKFSLTSLCLHKLCRGFKFKLTIKNKAYNNFIIDLLERNEVFQTTFQNKYLVITWKASGFLKQTKSLYFVIKSFKNHSSNLHFEVQSGQKQLQVPIQGL